jgi:Ca2+-binding EF-hand superfamily protein
LKEEKLWSAFKYFDINDSGYITSESMIEALKTNNIPVNESGLIDVFETLNKNKKLSFEEFKKIFQNK